MDSLPADADARPLAALSRFRVDFHACLTARRDELPDRRHVQGKTRAEAAEKVRALEHERDQGTVRKAGPKWTVASWLTFWVGAIAAPPHVAENTHLGYKVDVNR